MPPEGKFGLNPHLFVGVDAYGVLPWWQSNEGRRTNKKGRSDAHNFEQDIAYDTQPIRRELGFREPISWEEAVRKTLEPVCA